MSMTTNYSHNHSPAIPNRSPLLDLDSRALQHPGDPIAPVPARHQAHVPQLWGSPFRDHRDSGLGTWDSELELHRSGRGGIECEAVGLPCWKIQRIFAADFPGFPDVQKRWM